MFELFKKPEQETETAAPNEAPDENMEETSNETEYIIPENPEPCESTKNNSLSVLESLEKEEQALLEEKAQLINMEVTLWQKIAEEIETKKHRIENLKHEISELRQRCDALAEALNMSTNQ